MLIRDRAGCVWVLATMFLGGGLTVLALLLGWVGTSRPSGWVFALALVIAVVHIAAGVWLVARTPRIRVRLGPHDRSLMVERGWPWSRRHRRIAADELAAVVIREVEDSDGDPCWYLDARLRSGERLALTSVASHARNEVQAAAERLQSWAGGSLPIEEEKSG